MMSMNKLVQVGKCDHCDVLDVFKFRHFYQIPESTAPFDDWWKGYMDNCDEIIAIAKALDVLTFTIKMLENIAFSYSKHYYFIYFNIPLYNTLNIKNFVLTFNTLK